MLEHIEDDIRALRLFRELVAPTGGQVLIFVPAVQAAYGPLDAALGHHRRYSKRTLRRAPSTRPASTLVTLRYTNPIGLLGWMYNAHVSGNTEHTSGQVRLFERLVAPWALPLDRARGAADRAVALRRRPRPRALRMSVPVLQARSAPPRTCRPIRCSRS